MRRLVPPYIQELVERGLTDGTSDGAALIIDAEGSTSLAARLEPYGTVGAESLASILAAIFRPMVERVTSAGGVIAELAGDGVLAVFPGSHRTTVTAAIAAASRVMEDLQSLSEFDTPDGPASLTVRSTVGSGTIDYRIWVSDDDSPQNAAFATSGSAVDEARTGESLTPGGVISAGPVAAHQVDSAQLIESLADGFVTVRRLTNDYAPPVAAAPASATSEPRFYPPILDREDLRHEFRDVVSVFVDFAPSSAAVVDNQVSEVLEELSRFDGYLNHITRPSAESGSIRSVALWGAPTSREDDIGYALRFLEELRDRHHTRVRAGITLSAAFTGFIGGPSQEVYTAIGPGVNLAARLCSTAEWGEFRIDRASTSRLEEPWGVEAVGPVDYRGFSTPIDTARVTYVPPVKVGEDLTKGAFVGRTREMDRLEDMIAPLWSGRPVGVVAVSGEPGVGKSRLVGALEERLSHRDPAPVWLRAQADEIRSQPLATLRDALAGYFGRPGREESAHELDAYLEGLGTNTPDRASEMARTRSALGDLLDLAVDVSAAEKLDPKTRFDNLVIAVENVIEALERNNPVIISIADAQWMDTGTAEVLRRVVSNNERERLALVLETRDHAQGLEPGHLLELGPLEKSQIASLASQVLGHSPSADLVDDLMTRSGGNPFFAEQLLGSAELETLQTEALPVDIRRLLVARLDGMSGETRRIVQTASVLGREVDLEVLQGMAKEVDVAAPVEDAVRAGIWERVGDANVSFASLLIRDAAYGMLLHADARKLHGEAAAAIESRLGPDERRDAELAYHHEHAGHLDRAARHYVEAGRLAANRYDNPQAHRHYDSALVLIPEADAGWRYDTLRLQHDVFAVEGERASQESTISSMELIVDSGDNDRLTEIALLRGRLLVSLGKYQEAEALISAVAAPEDGRMVFLRAQLARYLGRSDEAADLASQARQLFERGDDDVLMAVTNDFLGGIAWENGDYDEAVELHGSAAEMFEQHGRVMEQTGALNNLGTAVFSIGDYSRAREIHRSGAKSAREIGYRMSEGDHLDNMGGTAWAVGDFDLALRYYNEALQIRQGMDDAWGVAISTGNLGSTKRAMGEPEEALVLYRKALEIDEEIGRRRGEAYDLHGIGLCHLDLGHHNLASESLKRSAQLREELNEPHLANESHIACALAMLRSGDPVGAGSLVESVLDSEGDDFFEAAVETTATRLRCLEVLEATSPERAEKLRERTSQGVLQRAERISDPDQRRSYLEEVESHSTAMKGLD